MKQRLDKAVLAAGLVGSRSQAENYIRLGVVTVDGQVVRKAGTMVSDDAKLCLNLDKRYVSRAGLKLSSVADIFGIEFADKTVLDIGSSTGGFTDYALQHGARKVIAVDVGTDQLHPSLRGNRQIELHEKTDIRDFRTDQKIDIIVVDVSFISLRDILPHVSRNLMSPDTQLAAMVKPQFEASRQQVSKGVIKNNSVRRKILNDFEAWTRQYFVVTAKRDSDVAGAHGNLERFYLLKNINR